MKTKINLLLYLALFLFSLSCKEKNTTSKEVAHKQSEVSEIKKIKTVSQVKDCVDYFDQEVSKVYPITGKKIDNEEFPENLIDIAQSSSNMHEKIKEVLFDGSILKLNCSGDAIFQLIITLDNGNLIVYLSVEKNGDIDIKKLHGTYVHDFKNIDEYSFLLDHENLEVTKTNFMNTENYKKKEVSKETKKYKLTENGLVEL